MSSSNLTTSPRATALTPGGRAMSMPKSLRRSSPVASKPAWRGPPGNVLDAAELDGQAHAGGSTSPMVSVAVDEPAVAVASVIDVRAERHGRAALDVEEVGRRDVGVAVGVAGVDRRQVDGGRRRDVSSSVGADDDVDVEALEAAAHLRDAEVADREADRRVGRVERPAAGGEGEGGAWRWWSWRPSCGASGGTGKAGSILVLGRARLLAAAIPA